MCLLAGRNIIGAIGIGLLTFCLNSCFTHPIPCFGYRSAQVSIKEFDCGELLTFILILPSSVF